MNSVSAQHRSPLEEASHRNGGVRCQCRTFDRQTGGEFEDPWKQISDARSVILFRESLAANDVLAFACRTTVAIRARTLAALYRGDE